MVIPVSGLAFPVSVPTVGFWFDRAGTKCWLQGSYPACKPWAVNTCTFTNTQNVEMLCMSGHMEFHTLPYCRHVPMHTHMSVCIQMTHEI